MFRGGEYGARTPVELRETRDYNQETEFTLPLKQAAMIGACFGYTLVISPIIAVLAAGDAAFWLFTGIWMTTTFVWYLRRSGNLVTEDNRPIVEVYGENVCNTLAWLEIFAGCAMSLMPGLIAFCFHKVIVLLEFVPPWWLRFILVGGGRLIGIAQFPAAMVMSWFVLLSFGQELVQRSPFMEQFVWKAVGAILELWGGQWVRDIVREPILIKERQKSTNDNGVTIRERARRSEEQIFAEMVVEFIRRGEKRGYSRAKWVGKNGVILECTGATMPQSKWTLITQRLKDAGIMDRVDGETDLLCSVEEALEHVSHPSFYS